MSETKTVINRAYSVVASCGVGRGRKKLTAVLSAADPASAALKMLIGLKSEDLLKLVHVEPFDPSWRPKDTKYTKDHLPAGNKVSFAGAEKGM